MKLDPRLPAVHFRPLLASCLPPNTELSSAFLSQLRRRCQLFLVFGIDNDSTGNNDDNKLLSTTDLSQHKIDVLDALIVGANCRSMYITIMTNCFEN